MGTDGGLFTTKYTKDTKTGAEGFNREETRSGANEAVGI